MTDVENKMRASFEQSLAKEYEKRGYFGPIGGQHSAATPLNGGAPTQPALSKASARLSTVAEAVASIRERLAALRGRLIGPCLASDMPTTHTPVTHTPAVGFLNVIDHDIQRLAEGIAGINDLLDKLDEII